MLFADEDLEPGIRKTFAALLKHCPKNASFWDVGANIGLFSFTFASMRPESSVVSIEPDEKNLACLRRTTKEWKLPNHFVFAGVAGETNGDVTFHLDDASGATGSIEEPSDSFSSRLLNTAPRSVTVSMRSVDSLAQELGVTPGIMKIDVEGAEIRVLRGAQSVVEHHHPTIFLETFEHAEECKAFLLPLGYSMFDADRLSATRERLQTSYVSI
jgi:FkbM family methyltransferase